MKHLVPSRTFTRYTGGKQRNTSLQPAITSKQQIKTPNFFLRNFHSRVKQNKYFHFQTKTFFLSIRLQDSWLCRNHPLQLSQTVPAQMCRGLYFSKGMQRTGGTRQLHVFKNTLGSCRIRRRKQECNPSLRSCVWRGWWVITESRLAMGLLAVGTRTRNTRIRLAPAFSPRAEQIVCQ